MNDSETYDHDPPSEDPHERELDDIERQIKELESTDKEVTSGLKSSEASLTKGKSDTVDNTYEEKSKDDWKRSEHKNEERLTYTEDEIDILEEDL